jgi:ribonucrease Y
MAFFRNASDDSSEPASQMSTVQAPAPKTGGPKGKSFKPTDIPESILDTLAEITKRETLLNERELLLEEKEGELKKTIEQNKKLEAELESKLEKSSHMTVEEAKATLFSQIEKRLADDTAKRIRQAEEQTKATATDLARDIILDSMIHGATEYTAEYTVSTVRIPDDEAKGRIIGREGRNIKTFEQATGVEIELDETNDVRLSSFDSVRREIARLSLEKLIKDSRIQPGRIEEIVRQTQSQMELVLMEEGKRIAAACGVYNLHPDLIRLIGKFKFRFSYGQNLALHTIEETKIGVAIAAELKGDVESVRLGCLLHDIGKVVTDEEGTHVQLGVELLKRYALPQVVINAVAEHHEDKPFSSSVSRIVWIADAISGSRPGARYEPHGEYVKRMSQIEEIAKSYAGVETAYAFQAGRDVRILVKPEEISDSELTVLVRKVADHLEKEAQYAGQIKVTGIREFRAMETTKAK